MQSTLFLTTAPQGGVSMRFHGSGFPRFTILALVVLLTAVPFALGQANRSNSQSRDAGYRSAIVSGQKLKIKGTIEGRDADTISIRDERNMKTVVLLTDRTSVK